LVKLIPSSVAVGSGTGSVNATGVVTFSGASSVSLNGIFSSSYDNYRIIYTASTSTATNYLQGRLRTTSDDSTSNYGSVMIYASYSSGATPGQDSGGSGVSSWTRMSYLVNGQPLQASIDIFNPFLSRATSFGAICPRHDGWGAYTNGVFAATTSFTGLTFISAAGNASGEIVILGYN
jgi:hypothetical protein